MRIERPSNNTIKIYLSRNYLQARDLNAQVLLENSDLFDHLIWDVVDHANIEFGHDFNENQLDIIHLFDENGGLEITITHSYEGNSNVRIPHDDSDNYMMEHFTKLLYSAADSIRKNAHTGKSNRDVPTEQNKDIDSYANKIIGINASSSHTDEQTVDAFKSMMNKGHVSNENSFSEDAPKNTEVQAAPPNSSIPFNKNSLSLDWDVLVFPDFSDMIEFFIKNKNFKTIASSLYVYRGAYYLLVKPNKTNLNLLNKLEAMSLDYNASFLPAETFLPLLKERGNVVMENGAISKIIKHFSY